MGDHSDAVLSDDLKFFIEMFQIKRERNKDLKGIVMEDADGHKILVKEGGNNLKLHEEKAEIKENEDGSITFSGVLKDKKSLENVLAKLVKRGKLTQQQADVISSKSRPNAERKILSGNISITQKAFPSIVKTLVNFYVHSTADTSIVGHLKPYMLGQRECKDIMAITVLPHYRLAPDFDSVYHTIRIKGKNGDGLVGMIEFFNVYSYSVVLDENYSGVPVDLSYCYDLIGQEERTGYKPDVNLSVEAVKQLQSSYQTRPQPFWSEIKLRMDWILALKMEIDRDRELCHIIEDTFKSIPEGNPITEETINQLSDRIINELILPRLK